VQGEGIVGMGEWLIVVSIWVSVRVSVSIGVFIKSSQILHCIMVGFG